MPSELKPCPFCRRKTKIVFSMYGSLYMVVCESCGAIVSFKGNESKTAVRELYNRRADNG
jgi:transcription elongation factor Elf1